MNDWVPAWDGDKFINLHHVATLKAEPTRVVAYFPDGSKDVLFRGPGAQRWLAEFMVTRT